MGNEPNDRQKLENKDPSMDPMEQDEAPAEIAAAAMTVKLQPFWPDSPENWFLLAEIQFDMQKVKAESTRYLQTLAALPASIHDKISDLLRAPPTQNQYTKLKTTLLSRLAPSDEKQLEMLLSGRDIGDRIPSEVLRHIRELARDAFSDKIIKSLWSRKMPEIIRIAIAAQPDATPTNTLAETADRMYEAMSTDQQQLAPISRQSRPRSRYNENMQHSGDKKTITNTTNTIEDRLARIEARLDRISQFNRSRSLSQTQRFQSQSRYRNRSRPRSSNRNNTRIRGTCWFHQTFGTTARKCIKPCQFRQSTPTMDVDSQQQKN